MRLCGPWRTRVKRTLTVMGMASALALASCDETAEQAIATSDRTPKTSASVVATAEGPCSFITQAEMSTVLGRSVTRQEPSGRRCIYYTEDPLVFVDLELDRQTAAESWKGVNAGNALIGAAQNSVPNLGEQAFFGPRDRLYVLSGQAFLAIEAGFDNAVRERARKVAMLALHKLR